MALISLYRLGVVTDRGGKTPEREDHVRQRSRRRAATLLLLPIGIMITSTLAGGLTGRPAGAAGTPPPGHSGSGSAHALSAPTQSVDFGAAPIGLISPPTQIDLTNSGPRNDTVTGFAFGGADPDDFIVAWDPSSCAPVAPSAQCVIEIGFLPGLTGPRSATLTPVDSAGSAPTIQLSGTGTEGYYVGTANGAVDGYGNDQLFGDASGLPLNRPIVDVASTGDDAGYWLVATDGGIFSYGDAGFFGSTGGIELNKPIVGMTPTADSGGYWLVASDGGIFNYGDAGFYGSTGSIHLNKPIVGMAATPDGGGYWLVASDGGIFSYGDARFYGSTGAISLNKPIVGMAVTPDGGGYWLVASDGGIFNFGDAGFYGSSGAIHLVQPIVGMASTPDGGGYWLVAADGGVFNYGDAAYDGSAGGTGISNAVSIASTTAPTLQAESDAPALRAADLRRFRASLPGAVVVRG